MLIRAIKTNRQTLLPFVKNILCRVTSTQHFGIVVMVMDECDTNILHFACCFSSIRWARDPMNVVDSVKLVTQLYTLLVWQMWLQLKKKSTSYQSEVSDDHRPAVDHPQGE